MLSLMKKDGFPSFQSESCNEAYLYFVPLPKGCSLPVHLPFLGTDISENSCLLLHQQKTFRLNTAIHPEHCSILTCNPFQIFCTFLAHRLRDH